MRRIRRLFFLLLLLFIAFTVFLRVTAPGYPESTVAISEGPQHANSGLSHRQPFAYSAFLHLGNSLTAAATHARSVLFVAGSTRAASRLIHVANDLAVEFERATDDSTEVWTSASKRDSYIKPAVHLLFMGPYSVNLEFFAKANGANSSLLFIHDGRAKLNQRGRLLPTVKGEDSTTESESLTMFDISQGGVRAAMETAYRFVRPEVAIWSRDSEYDANFGSHVDSLLGNPSSRWAPIDLPARDMEELRWLAFLGVDGLKHWSRHAFDIIIPVVSHSGSLIRLLDSIAHAHYYNFFPRPRITIYLPPGPADPSLINYIERALAWSPERIILQTVPSLASGPQQNSLREAMFAAAIRSHVPSAKHAHTIVLADTVRLSRYWFQWTMFHLLRFSSSVMDSEMTQNLPPLGGISLCPITTETSLPPYFLTQSKVSLSCAMFFAPHFRVLQTYFSEQTANAASVGVKRTLPVPEELSFLRNHIDASQFDIHELLLPLYMRGYLFLSQTSLLVPAIDDLLVTAKEKRLKEMPHSLIELPLYDWIFETRVDRELRARDGGDDAWTGLQIIPDWNSEAASSVESVQQRGVEFASFVSPRCNVVVSVRSKPGMEKEEQLASSRRLADESTDQKLEVNRNDDDWSDVFCASMELEDDTTADAPAKPQRAKTREDEKRERKAKKVVVAANERRPSTEGKAPETPAKPVQPHERSGSGSSENVAETDRIAPDAQVKNPRKESSAAEPAM
ncbi:hypothetical protein POJ06DRAFT_258965 [Lipomyces tetrasporus]|uniref:Uncharacterized protein n=1 Tax=Lipomyces tetrasporus TaxID=54092 RepID=A0AAD7QR18_9ASCO|nr:uncharacterized protein POJ06DRAFT_258965 [Lipomyces tetrasporus]KAJ8098252.1 hypothetical protein POJ06DRAFT_258965 [Lipomyces tetrasporus]